MRETASREIRQQNIVRSARYILEHQAASRQELAGALELSMPTVFQCVNELIDRKIIVEAGEYSSTGGRKAKVLRIREGVHHALGIEISRERIRIVLVDLSGALLKSQSFFLPYENTRQYYEALSQMIKDFIQDTESAEGLLGVGMSIPGILDTSAGFLRQSHALGVTEVSLKSFSQDISFPVWFENDANNAACAELEERKRDTVYLSLNDTVGGAIFLSSHLYKGDNFKSAEFGHMMIIPGGRRCYCGKKGCLDPYCSAQILRDPDDQSLESFFVKLARGDAQCVSRWEEYAGYLAIAIDNLRTIFDCDILLGGDVGGYLGPWLFDLKERLRQYNNVDSDISFLQVGRFCKESSAIGAARQVISHFINYI